jgi:N-acyl homoserine lactone hydrolase
MTNCIIHPIPILETKIDKSLMTYRMNFGQTISSISYVWYIEGTNEIVLVDAGANAEYLSAVRKMPARLIQTFNSGLDKLGINFEDVDLVILTHLHHDHVAEALKFPKAKFLVQKRELEFALNPHPSVAVQYNREFLEGLRFEVIDGDAKISEEISILYTPGHTPGGQSVMVNTIQGTAMIAGLCSIQENFDPPPPIREVSPVITPGMHTHALEAYDSVIKITEIADIIVPIHEPAFQQKDSIP